MAKWLSLALLGALLASAPRASAHEPRSIRVAMDLGAGVWTQHLSLPSRGFTLPGTAQSYGAAMRAHIYATPALYFGFDWGFGLGTAKSEVTSAMWFHSKYGGLIGTRVPFGHVSLRLEAKVGMEIMTLQQQHLGGTPSHPSAIGLLIEPRAALDLWTSPTSTLTLLAGTNLRHPSEASFGLSMSFHTAPFDGRF